MREHNRKPQAKKPPTTAAEPQTKNPPQTVEPPSLPADQRKEAVEPLISPITVWKDAVCERTAKSDVPISGVKAAELLKKEKPELYAAYLAAVNPIVAVQSLAETLSDEEIEEEISKWESLLDKEIMRQVKKHPVIVTQKLRESQPEQFQIYLAAVSAKKKRENK